jgi:hypothetical protein
MRDFILLTWDGLVRTLYNIVIPASSIKVEFPTVSLLRNSCTEF